MNPTPSSAAASGQTMDWRELVVHAEAVLATEPTDTVFDRFKKHSHAFMAVLDGPHPVGICGRREIGMLLGGRYGYALYARKPVRAHMAPSVLCVSVEMTVEAVLGAVFGREAESFYDDVVLVDAAGCFLGLIPVHALVRLQTGLREEQMRQLETHRREISDKNEQMEADLSLAREMQLTLLPREFPAFPPEASCESSRLRFAHLYLPSTSVSGDFFHVLPLDDRRAGVFICDVMGHGVRAALVTAMVRVLVQEACRHASDAAALLARINHGLMEIIPHDAGVMFVTAAYAIFDVERQSVQYASAGHPELLRVQRSSGKVIALKVPREDFNPALGVFPQATFHLYEQPLEEGDVVLFHTDGLFEVETTTGDQLGTDGLVECIAACAGQPLAKMVPNILAEVRRRAPDGFDDDVCLLATEFTAPPKA